MNVPDFQLMIKLGEDVKAINVAMLLATTALTNEETYVAIRILREQLMATLDTSNKIMFGAIS